MPTVRLPTLHDDQVKAFLRPGRYKAIRCGRRWGKTILAETIAADGAAKGEPIGWFTPLYKFLAEPFRDIADILAPIKLSSSKNEGSIRTVTGGVIDFWTLEDDRAGRGRKYKKIVVDEAAFTKPGSIGTWEKSIEPTLLDYGGSALFFSNTNGVEPDNLFWQICNEAKHGFVEYHAPTHRNPHMPADALVKLQASKHPLVFKQEYLAEFVDWSGEAFFSLKDLLDDGQPVEPTLPVEAVFATIDTAVKTGKENDGTGLVFWALSTHGARFPLFALDWDLIQIEGALLEAWLPTVFQRLEGFARSLRARKGSLGVWIEDKASGMVLLQQARRRGWMAHEISSTLTALGKVERAINISGYFVQGLIKLTSTAHDRVAVYKENSRNHLESQITGFRVGAKDQGEDDLLDAFCYGIAIALGNEKGF